MKRDLTGSTFGYLTAIRRLEDTRASGYPWLCICACGKEATVRIESLAQGKTLSCGCKRIEACLARTKHGHSRRIGKTKTYIVWRAMHQRCKQPKNNHYKYYGGRGIKICERWGSYENFLIDMGERPDGLSIDRINNDGDYEPSNCRWATHTQQMNNTRRWPKL